MDTLVWIALIVAAAVIIILYMFRGARSKPPLKADRDRLEAGTETWEPTTAVIVLENAGQVEQLKILGKGTVGDIAFSPDSRTLAVGGSIGIHLYNAATLTERAYIPSDSWILCVAFSPDGLTLATGSNDKTVRLWDVADGRLL
ncbi:MAG TPA: hypothetical protein PLR07_12205, partial [Promineifilum sp.]|nr:hypothetical protein [Promineifilum sp.]